MWIKIDNYEIFTDIRLGSLISQKPNNPNGTFEVGLKTDGYVSASHIIGELELTILSVKELIGDNWWLRE